MATAYATLSDLKTRLNIDITDGDAELQRALDAASRAVDQHTSQAFYPTNEARTFTPRNRREVKFGPFNGAVEVTEVATGAGFADVWPADAYQLLTRLGDTTPQGASAEPEPWARLRAIGRDFPLPTLGGRVDTVRVNGTWGWAAPPAAVVEATLIMATELYKMKDAPFGVAGYGDFGPLRVGRDSPKAASLLAPYTLMPVG